MGHSSGEPGSGGTGAGSGGFGGSLISDGGASWQKGGTGNYPPPTGGTGFVGNEDCDSFCATLGQRCHFDSQSCVECFKDQDCEPGLYCHPRLNRCVSCFDELGCPDDRWCDNQGQCREPCLTSSHPARECRDESQVCDEDRSVCIACRKDEHCEGSEDGPFCLPGGARCAECVADDDCTRDKPRCDPVGFTCVACRDSRDCDFPHVCHPETHECYDSRFEVPFPT